MGILDRLAIRHFPPAPESYNGNGRHVAPMAQAAPAVTTPTSVFPFWVTDENDRIVREITDGATRRGLGAYLANVLVYGAVNYRMRKVAEAPLIPVDVRDAGNPWIEDHEIAPLLAQPNPDQTGHEFLEEHQMYMDSTGMCLWVKSRDRAGRVGELRAFHGDEFTVEQITRVSDEEFRQGRRPRLYGRFRVGSVRNDPFYPEDVVFFRYPHPTDRFRGLAPVRVVADVLGIGEALTGHVRRALENGAQVGGIFTVPPDRNLTDEEFRRLDALIRSKYSGGNSYRPMLGEGGLTFSPMAHSFRDLELGSLWREVETAVCTAFSVRPELLPMLVGMENSPWSHMATAQRLAYDEAVIPLWTRYEAVVTNQLLRDFDDDKAHELRFDTSEIPALQDDLKEKADILTKVGKDMTRDERRSFMGFQPLTAAQRRELEEESRPVAVSVEDEGEDPVEVAARSRRPVVLARATTIEEALWEEIANPLELNLWLVVQGLLQGDRITIAEIIRAGLEFGVLSTAFAGKVLQQTDQRFTPEGEVGRRWASVTRPHLRDATRAGVGRLPAAIRDRVPFGPDEIAGFADEEAAFLVQSVTDTTRSAIREAVKESLAASESVEQLAARIDALEAFGDARARLIAQTETTRTLNGAAEAAAHKFEAETGSKVMRTWHTQEDARVRPLHAAQNGAQRRVGEPFPNGVTHPSEPGCRCFLTYQVMP